MLDASAGNDYMAPLLNRFHELFSFDAYRAFPNPLWPMIDDHHRRFALKSPSHCSCKTTIAAAKIDYSQTLLPLSPANIKIPTYVLSESLFAIKCDFLICIILLVNFIEIVFIIALQKRGYRHVGCRNSIAAVTP